MNALTEQNIRFMNHTHKLNVSIGVEVLVNCNLDNHSKYLEVRKFTLDEYFINIFKEENEKVVSKKIINNLLNIFLLNLEIVDKNEIFELLNTICPRISDFWDRESIDKWFNDIELLEAFIISDFEKLNELIQINTSKNLFYLEVGLYLAIEFPNEFKIFNNMLDKILFKLQKNLNPEQLEYIQENLIDC